MLKKLDSPTKLGNKKKIAYIIGRFPHLNTTFIDREIVEAKKQGLNLALLSIRPFEPFEMRPEIRNLYKETIYLLPVPLLKFIISHLYFFMVRPWSYISTFFYLMTRRHPDFKSRIKTILHFGGGVWAAKLLRAEDVDHIHAHFADRAAVVAMVASRLLKLPYSLTAHAVDIYVSPVMLHEKMANAEFVTTCTAYNKAYMERLTGYPVELIYHGLDLTTLPSPSQRKHNYSPCLILSVGQLKEKKGFPYLIKACRLLKDEGRNVTCEIIGEGPYREELERLITKLNLNNVVMLRGSLPHKEVLAKYPEAAVFVLSCIMAKNGDRDGIPNVLLEAMVNHIPVISTNLSGIPEVVENGTTGLLVPPGDEKALAEAIASLLDNDELNERLGRQGCQKVEEKFNVNKNVKALINLFGGS
jgi:glycosyltransferase involved in cell wall biosynthesis